MNIGLIGYGKMGKAIEEIALQRGHRIVFRVNSSLPIDKVDLNTADVLIEFTNPEMVLSHIHAAIDANVPIVVGSTGWNSKLDEVTELVTAQNASLLYASNFSIGVNLFFEINKKLARLMGDFSEYQCSLEEIHHTQKLDSPSGTAISIANDILENNDSYMSWVCGENTPPHVNSNQLSLTAYREENVPGTHLVSYKSEIDTIEIKHVAHNRKGFASGAVIAAEWLLHQKGVYTMSDVLKINEL
jgi:4-hydroxy-tetrahydrodipicolinate reductase